MKDVKPQVEKISENGYVSYAPLNEYIMEECINKKMTDFKGNIIADGVGIVSDCLLFNERGYVRTFDQYLIFDAERAEIYGGLENGERNGETFIKRGTDVDGWEIIESQANSEIFGFTIDECYQTASGVYVISKGWLCLMFDSEGNGTPGQYALWSIGDCGSPELAMDGEYAPVEGVHFWKLD